MADKQSREVHKPSEQALVIRKLILERGLDYARSLTPKQVDTVLELAKEYEGLAKQTSSVDALTVKLTADVSDALRGLKAVQREARKTTRVLKELEQEESPLLRIEVESLDDVPKVFYKGKEVQGKTKVDYLWETRTAELDSGNHSFILNYVEAGEDGMPHRKEVEENRWYG